MKYNIWVIKWVDEGTHNIPYYHNYKADINTAYKDLEKLLGCYVGSYYDKIELEVREVE